ncbi:MAG TPA: transcriptional regulator, partial [Terracidiphilus sp.]|nr:transcriptional regulator [Terracidiphilus sp.]
QPDHLYLGTTNSWIYESTDGGSSWHRLSRLDDHDDLIVDHILVDRAHPALVYAAAWTLGHPGGGLWISHDGGRTWVESSGMHGQSIRAFAQAPSSANILFAGTLEGVFRSLDAGATWTRISPLNSREIHEVESLAVDPADPEIVYAGTWHLPWKTTDGGKSWHSIKRGVIDDSDVFSIVVDPGRPNVVYASACSGIYKSLNAGELFHKIQGIPSTARRTRVLRQDPVNHGIVYAGTTEGLYRTLDGGKTFHRLTGSGVIINDVFVDPANARRVLLATDRGGVLLSTDGGRHFAPSNQGFSGRKVEALLVDRGNPARIFAGVVNDKAYGSFFESFDGGMSWKQAADGLDGRDVFALAQAPGGTLLAGTNDGIFALEAGATAWQPRNTIANTLVKTQTERVRGTRVNIERQVKDKLRVLDGRVYAFALQKDVWAAATAGGLFTSRDHGATWQGGPVMGVAGYRSITAHGSLIAAARPDGVVLSKDSGESWWPMSVPTMLTRIHRIAFSPDGTLWLGAREGVYFTRDKGRTWMWVHRLPLVDVDDLYFDAHLNRVLVSSRASRIVYAIDPDTLAWQWWQTGFRLASVRAAGGRLLAASLYDGVLLEPRSAGAEVGQR